jgi:hypothetical protein
VTFGADLTALLVVEPYDALSEGGKLWPNVKVIAEAVNCVPNIRNVLHAARDAGLRVSSSPIAAGAKFSVLLTNNSEAKTLQAKIFR